MKAIFGLSFCLALIDALMKEERATHTRRYRELDKLTAQLNKCLELYPGQIDQKTFDHAVHVFNTLEQEVKGGA